VFFVGWLVEDENIERSWLNRVNHDGRDFVVFKSKYFKIHIEVAQHGRDGNKKCVCADLPPIAKLRQFSGF